MWSSAASLGAPVTDPGGKVASISVGPAEPGSQPALDGAHQVHEARVRLDGEQGRHLHRSPLAHPAEVVADEVDDHHVLGPVLGQEVVDGGGRALDRRRPHPVAVAGEEPLGRRRRHLDPVPGQADDGAERRRVARRPAPRRGRPTSAPGRGQGSAQPAGEVHLVHVAGADGRRGSARRPPRRRGRSRLVVQASAGGPTHGGPGPGSGRPHVGEPGAHRRARERQHDGPEPVRSRARSDRSVTSTQPGRQAPADHGQRGVGVDAPRCTRLRSGRHAYHPRP